MLDKNKIQFEVNGKKIEKEEKIPHVQIHMSTTLLTALPDFDKKRAIDDVLY